MASKEGKKMNVFTKAKLAQAEDPDDDGKQIRIVKAPSTLSSVGESGKALHCILIHGLQRTRLEGQGKEAAG